MKIIQQFPAWFAKKKLSGKLFIGCSSLFILFCLYSFPTALLSPSTPTPETADVSSAQTAVAGINQIANANTPTNTPEATETPLPTKDPNAALKEQVGIQTNGAISFEGDKIFFEREGQKFYLEQVIFGPNGFVLDMGDLGLYDFDANDIDIEDGILRVTGFRFNSENMKFEVVNINGFVSMGKIQSSNGEAFFKNEIPVCALDHTSLKDLFRYLKFNMTTKFDLSKLTTLPIKLIYGNGIVFSDGEKYITRQEQSPFRMMGACLFVDEVGRNFLAFGIEMPNPDPLKNEPKDNVVFIGLSPKFYYGSSDSSKIGKNSPVVSIKQSLKEAGFINYPVVFINGDAYFGAPFDGMSDYYDDETLAAVNELISNQGNGITLTVNMDGKIIVVGPESMGYTNK